MSDKLFRRIVTAIIIIGALSTAVLVAYTWNLHQHCSIISYIANGG
ncbi:MAG: hypothetical protein K2K14_03530 [Ruminococcus sp.]|nr:hypothetical protein [Ruminococcus sp.]